MKQYLLLHKGVAVGCYHAEEAPEHPVYGVVEYGGDFSQVHNKVFCAGEWILPPAPPNRHCEWQDDCWVDLRSSEQVAADTALELEVAWIGVRTERNKRLTESDWVELRALRVGEPVSSEWMTYRQALLDITEQADPENIVWPIPPSN